MTEQKAPNVPAEMDADRAEAERAKRWIAALPTLDPLAREILEAVEELDDREGTGEGTLPEIAERVMDIYSAADRNIRVGVTGVNFAELADRIVDWANYGLAYGDYSGAPWRDQ